MFLSPAVGGAKAELIQDIPRDGGKQQGHSEQAGALCTCVHVCLYAYVSGVTEPTSY